MQIYIFLQSIFVEEFGQKDNMRAKASHLNRVAIDHMPHRYQLVRLICVIEFNSFFLVSKKVVQLGANCLNFEISGDPKIWIHIPFLYLIFRFDEYLVHISKFIRNNALECSLFADLSKMSCLNFLQVGLL